MKLKIFGLPVFELSTKTPPLYNVPDAGWYPLIRETYSGAWQVDATPDSPRNLLAFSAVYACVKTIAADIGKLHVRLFEFDDPDQIWTEVKRNDPRRNVLKRPNHFQTWKKFIQCWVVSKLMNGNAYVLKERDARGVVRAMYVLDPTRVVPLVAITGDVYYQLKRDDLSGVPQSEDGLTVPASEIIHDLMTPLWHPLVGVSPIYACALAATMGNKVVASSTNFFGNYARPSGMLTAPGDISKETAQRLKDDWASNYGGTNAGKIAVAGNGLKFEQFSMSAEDAQTIKQLDWSVEDVARAFNFPLYKLQRGTPTYNNVEALNQAYYSDCLQELIESIEELLDDGLGFGDNIGVELDIENLMRMDSGARFSKWSDAIKGMWFAPNEARRKENMRPVKGGEYPLAQQQNWTLEQLAGRDAPTSNPASAPASQQSPPSDGTAPPSPPPTPPKGADADQAASIFESLVEAVTHG